MKQENIFFKVRKYIKREETTTDAIDICKVK